MRLELQETQKATLHALIEEIGAYLDARVEVEYIQIRNRYKAAAKAVEGTQYPRVWTPSRWYIHYVSLY